MTAAWMAVLFAPIHRYAPDCGRYDWSDDRIHAPLRPTYADMLAQALKADGLLFLRWRSVIFLPLMDVTDIARIGRIVMGEFVMTDVRDSANFVWRHAFNIAGGYRAEGSGFPVPAAVERLIARWEAEHGQSLPRNHHGYLSQPALRRLPSCALKRAALTTADDLPGEPP